MRAYAGATGDERQAERRQQLLEAGLELLASTDGLQDFTLRGVCREADLGTRYFYESFEDLDEFAVVIYDDEITELTIVTLGALEGIDSGDDEGRVRTALGAFISHIAEDPRRGRLIYSSALASVPAVAARRRESTRLFVGLLVDEANSTTSLNPPSEVVSEMLVGGLAQAIQAWLDGDITLSVDDLIDACSRFFLDTLRRAEPVPPRGEGRTSRGIRP
jgi:AcrR family transcriptional regulator